MTTVFTNVPKLQKRCKQACNKLVELLHNASLDINRVGKAWGQFLDYPQSNRQHGVYGTACAVKTLTILGEPVTSDFVKKGRRWLMYSFETDSSIANKKKDYALIYKYCFFLEALEPGANEVSNKVENLFQELLRRRLGGTGWGEHYFSDEHRSDQAKIIPTVVAIYVLRRYVPFIGSEACKEPLEWLEKQMLDGNARISPLEIAMLVLILDAYSKKHHELKTKAGSAGKLLERKIKETGRIKSLGDWYPHHFSIFDPDSGRWSNNYIYFPTDAIVALALIRNGQFWQNKRFITKVMQWYLENIEKNGGFLQPQLRRIATVDHYWLAQTMQEFLKVEAEGRLASLWKWLKARTWRFNLVRLLITIAAVILYGWLTYFQFQQVNLIIRTAVGTIIFIIVIAVTLLWGGRKS